MRYLLSLFFTGIISLSIAQTKDYTTESIKFSRIEAKTCEEIELVFEVDIAKDWYIYATDFEADGPIKTTVLWTPNTSYELVGKLQSIKPKTKYDEVWESNIAYFEKKAEFRQKIKILSTDINIKGVLNFQTCSNVTGQCLPPENVKFSFQSTDLKITKGACK